LTKTLEMPCAHSLSRTYEIVDENNELLLLTREAISFCLICFRV
jgi:hypothetical protein